MQIRTPSARAGRSCRAGGRNIHQSSKAAFFRLLAIAALGLAGLAASAHAEDAGARLALACGSCHGLDGRGGGAIPALAARDEQELLGLMRTLKKPADGVTIMPRMLRAYDDDELKALARHFAAIAP